MPLIETMQQTIGIYIVILLILYFTLPRLTQLKGILTIPIFIALSLVFCTLFIFNKTPIFLDEEKNALRFMEGLAEKNVNRDSLLGKELLMAVDVARHKQLVSKKDDWLADTTANTVVTDRQKLAALFTWLANDSIKCNVDLIVCDVLLTDSEIKDSLRNPMKLLSDENKLMLAKTVFDVSETDNELLPRYSVDVNKYDDTYFSHALLDTNRDPSLPYAMYLHRQKLDALSNRKLFFREDDKLPFWNGLVYNWLIPYMFLTNEDIQGKSINAPDNLWDKFIEIFLNQPVERDNLATSVLHKPIGLGACLQSNEQAYLLMQFRRAKNSKKRVTVVIGSFSGVDDLHQTAYGPIYGTVILLNVYLNLIAKSHHLSPGYGLFLLISFWLLMIVLFVLRVPHNRLFVLAKLRSFYNSRLSFLNTLRSYWLFRFLVFLLKELVLNQLHYWLLFLILFLSAACFGHIINVMGLTIFLAALDVSFRGIEELS